LSWWFGKVEFEVQKPLTRDCHYQIKQRSAEVKVLVLGSTCLRIRRGYVELMFDEAF
jgi:hypothetical protein